MPAGTSFGSDAGTQGRQLEPRRILQPHACNVGGAGRHPVLFYEPRSDSPAGEPSLPGARVIDEYYRAAA
jgi:hypothetical protein